MALEGPGGGGLRNAAPSAAAARELSAASFDPERSYDPERSVLLEKSSRAGTSPQPQLSQPSFASNKSFDPEAYHRSPSSMSDRSFDPERLSLPTALSSQASYDPERDLVTAQASYDPERSSMTSNTSYDPERQSIYSKSNNPEKSFDPERSHHSFASEASFDPERSTWGAAGSSSAAAFKTAEPEASIDPEASTLSLPSPRGPDASTLSSDFKRSGKHLDHIAAILRQAIKGDAPESLEQHSIDGDNVEGSRVCSTVYSFDPERGSSGEAGDSSREKSFGASEKSFDPESSQAMLSNKMSEKSFDPEASHLGLLSGPSYDPSADFAARHGSARNGSQQSADEFDPERAQRVASMRSEASFDPDNDPNPGHDVQKVTSQVEGTRALRVAPARGMLGDAAQVSPPGGKLRVAHPSGASICAALSMEGGKFLIRSVWDDAQTVARIGDEIVKVDGLNLHGMALEEVLEMLEGQPGTLVELDLRTTMGAPKVVTLSRKDVSVHRDSAASAGALGELSRVSIPTMNSPPSVGFAAGDQASMIQHFEGQYKDMLRGMAEKDRTIEELRANLEVQSKEALIAGPGVGEGAGMGKEGADISAALMEEMKNSLAAKDAEIARLRQQVQQAAEFNEKKSKAEEATEQELESAKEYAQAQAEGARVARARLEEAEARVRSSAENEKRLLAEAAELQQERVRLREEVERARAAATALAGSSTDMLANARAQGAAEKMSMVSSCAACVMIVLDYTLHLLF